MIPGYPPLPGGDCVILTGKMPRTSGQSDPRRGDLAQLAACARQIEQDQESAPIATAPDSHESPIAAIGPWLSSFVLHATLIIIAVGLIWSLPMVRENDPIIPSATLGKTRGAPLELATPQPPAESTTLEPLEQTDAADTLPSPLDVTLDQDRSLIGMFGRSITDASAFTPPPPPQAAAMSFYGLSGGNARKVVWVVDASGGMIDTLPFVLKELARAVEGLSDEQSFSIVFFQQDDALEAPPPGLRPATPANMRTALQWARRIVPRGTSNPLKAIETALSYDPQLIYLLSDNITGSGQFEIDRDKLLRDIQRVNQQATIINTIQFLYRDPLEQAGMTPTLELLATQTGGQYRFLSRTELGLE